jgi:hypothetical protein
MERGVLSHFCAHAVVLPVSGVYEDLRVGDCWLRRYYGVLLPSMAFTNKDVEKR